ncbi:MULTISPECIES: TerD family protein [Cytobacillus]|jgi:stress response protein SCP2|uniref:Stress protein n=3 Tax=Cytobacillus TaxID=2675230 RepID=A0A160MDL9_9BACI|nr:MULTISPECIES: TerD family protein [Cytobacillus]MBY0154921.1 TerD family protein [Cytobacillus firmus]AND41122.1 stress protein [Cytobacillus oceanisediminis 2691]MBU8731556.1 TerD family protein [Cytobacillus oceanisediminis]MBU8771240.1 TerD family protein [Cytobacillus oceanisediminis]MCM3243476.1 TerD family protein [Cytobacillus oceanisediminis]
MAINLQKGQRVDLTKGNPGLSKIMVGLGWDPVQKSGGGGLLGSLFGGGGGANIDCDASVIMLGENGKLKSNKDVIYFGNLKSSDGSVQHSGDNLTGAGDGDDEQVMVDLSRVPAHVHKMVFVVNIYDSVKRKQHFGMIQNAFIRVVNSGNNQELIKYNLTDDYSGKTSLIVGEIYRHGGDWKFAAVGTGTASPGLSDVVRSYS